MIPAKNVGGDFYDFFPLGDNRLGFVIGDVSGKGMPAALFMAISRTLLKAIALKSESTSECLTQVNYLLSQDNPKAMFVTLFYGVLNMSTGEVDYCNGGHNAPCMLSVDGRLEFLKQNGNSALGIKEDLEYQSGTALLESGSSLILFTDGIPEAVDNNQTEFSENRLKQYLQTCTTSSSMDIIHGLIEQVNTFVSGAPQSDDITALVIKNNR
jgi:sigma-B regulation protein RsbU (phosphoserine phosphatase)